jgi:hypothetical protein
MNLKIDVSNFHIKYNIDRSKLDFYFEINPKTIEIYSKEENSDFLD